MTQKVQGAELESAGQTAGQSSHAEGQGTTAPGTASHAEGLKSNATGAYAHAEGQNSTASGQASHAEGASSVSGQNAHAEGQSNAAVQNSHAEGQASVTGTQAIAAHAEGTSTVSGNAPYAHAEGQGTTAGASAAHAEGYLTQATGTYSHAEGNTSYAVTSAAHAEGSTTTASGTSSHAEGTGSQASGASSHAEGLNTVATGPYSHAGGQSAKADVMGAWARASVPPGNFNATRSQYAIYSLGISTGNLNAQVLTMDASAVSTAGTATNILIIPLLSTYLFTAMVTVRRLSGAATSSSGWYYSGMIARDAASSVRLVGSVTTLASWSDVSVGTVSISANTTNQSLQIQVTPSVAVGLVWHAVVQTNELTTAS